MNISGLSLLPMCDAGRSSRLDCAAKAYTSKSKKIVLGLCHSRFLHAETK